MQGLYAIVDVPHPHGLSALEVTRAVLAERLAGGEEGASVVQLRAKVATTADRIDMLRSMAPLCRAAAAPLYVDDDIDAALAGIEGVTGIHLGRDDPGADAIPTLRARAEEAGLGGERPWCVGLSTHDLRQLREAGRQGPDYLAFGPVCATGSKQNPDRMVGFSGLLDACRLAPRPLVAIGGLDAERGRRAIEAGAAAVAVIGALVDRTPAAIARRARVLSRAFAEAATPIPLEVVQQRVPALSLEQLAELAYLADDVGTHIELGLPARFHPRLQGDRPAYRPCDVLDLLYALDKHPEESWSQWRERTASTGPALVQLRGRNESP